MRKYLIFAATGTALFAASPAAAQWYPPSYGYHGGYTQYASARSLQARIDALQHQIYRLDRYNAISNREARRLREQSRDLERRLRYAARRGLHPSEAYGIQRRLATLEQRIAYAANYGNRAYRYAGHGWNDYRYDNRNYRYRSYRRDRDDDDDDD